MTDTKYIGITANQLAKIATDLKAENAKLRELVRDMRKALFTLNIDHCQACPRHPSYEGCGLNFVSTDTINGRIRSPLARGVWIEI